MNYVNKALALLEGAATEQNPYANTTPSPADGVRLEYETKEGRGANAACTPDAQCLTICFAADAFDAYETKGLGELRYTAFVLVAGGNNERYASIFVAF